MRSAECIITGADLIYVAEAGVGSRAVHGDLFELGEIYIFNAVVKGGEALWQTNVGRELALLVDPRFIWERRGVFIISKEHATLTPQAEAYVNKWR